MAKSRNNLLGVGGQRKKLSRADQHADGQSRTAAQRSADERKQDLLKKMRERTQGADAAETAADAAGADTADTTAATATGQE
ncbi:MULTISPECIES: DUF6243 family protein [unclassified Streptomyces]|uniref:DUF6243 family protein n=1 Tax=unclassified Streptomyces TaxID=2593676 RepID=UPI001654F4F9|nr:DUF6243 family protein [Streptomyces sp. CB02980]MCB8905429.1 DUF6243 family protein [Streptomyces sp. CB02980]